MNGFFFHAGKFLLHCTKVPLGHSAPKPRWFGVRVSRDVVGRPDFSCALEPGRAGRAEWVWIISRPSVTLRGRTGLADGVKKNVAVCFFFFFRNDSLVEV